MTYKVWNISVLTLVAIAVLSVAAINYYLDFYGVFGQVARPKLFIYDNERTTKYLFSYRYIPDNFDGLLVGPSISDNWNTGALDGPRIYNASIDGANISEEGLILENVLREHAPRVVFFVIHPSMTETFGRKSGYMNPQEYWAAWGSIQLFRGYVKRWLVEHRWATLAYNEFGREDFRIPVGAHEVKAHAGFFVDDQAFQTYNHLLFETRAAGTVVVGIIPPVELEEWKLNHSTYERYYSRLLPLFNANEQILNFNEAEFNSLRGDKVNFPDGIHLSPAAAGMVIVAINNRIRERQFAVALH